MDSDSSSDSESFMGVSVTDIEEANRDRFRSFHENLRQLRSKDKCKYNEFISLLVSMAKTVKNTPQSEKSDVVRLINGLFDDLEDKRSTWRTAADAADGLGIASGTTAVVGGIATLCTLGLAAPLALGASVASGATSVGMTIDAANKAKEFQKAVEDFNVDIADKLKNTAFGKLTSDLKKFKKICSEIKDSMDFPLILSGWLGLSLMKMETVGVDNFKRKHLKAVAKDLFKLLLDHKNLSAFQKFSRCDLSSTDSNNKEVVEELFRNLVLNSITQQVHIIMLSASGVTGIVVSAAWIMEMIKVTQLTRLQASLANSGHLSLKKLVALSKLGTVCASITIAIGIATVVLSIISLVNRADQMNTIKTKLFESRDKAVKEARRFYEALEEIQTKQ